MEISPVTKDFSAKQAIEYQKTTQQTVTPPAAADNKTLTPQAVQAIEKTNDSVKIKYSATSKNLGTVSAIEQIHSRINQLAKGVRLTNEGLNSASESLDQLQTDLKKIIKNFPPFLMDSPEREKILMSYVSIRKEIEQLVVPAPPAPVYEKVSGMWNSLFNTDGQIKSAVIPTLSSSSSDKQVKDASARVGRVSEQVSSLSDSITKIFVAS